MFGIMHMLKLLTDSTAEPYKNKELENDSAQMNYEKTVRQRKQSIVEILCTSSNGKPT